MRSRGLIARIAMAGLSSSAALGCVARQATLSPQHPPMSLASELRAPAPPGSVVVVESAAVRALLTVIRDKRSDHAAFERASRRLLTLLSEEALAQLPGVEAVKVETPCGIYDGLSRPPASLVVAVSIMRAGDALLEALRILEPGVAVGKFLIQRDETSPTKEARLSYAKLPASLGASTRGVLLLDPMLATGGSAALALRAIIAKGVPEDRIVLVNVVVSPEGLRRMREE